MPQSRIIEPSQPACKSGISGLTHSLLICRTLAFASFRRLSSSTGVKFLPALNDGSKRETESFDFIAFSLREWDVNISISIIPQRPHLQKGELPEWRRRGANTLDISQVMSSVTVKA